MLSIYHELVHRPDSVAGYFSQAMALWELIWERLGDTPSVGALAEALSGRQNEFEDRCGGRFLGQEIMAMTGFAQFYDPVTGFNPETLRKARLLADAFRASHCSSEVKGEADRLAKDYSLKDRHPFE